MRVVVNSGFLSGIYAGEYFIFLSKTFEILAKNHPGDEFIFLAGKEQAAGFNTGKNTRVHIIKQPADNLLLWKYWYDLKLPRLLRKYKADVVVTANGFCSLTARQPQCMILPDLAFIQFPSLFTKSQRFFNRRYMGKFAGKAARILTTTAFSKQEISQHYNAVKHKIDVVPNGVNPVFKPVGSEVKKEIKDRYTAGKDFFLYAGPLHPAKNLVNLLRAFSLFKKRQQSNLKLLLCGQEDPAYPSFLKNLKTYKYRSDVVYTGIRGEGELAAIAASAYALVYPVFFDAFSSPVLQSLQCGVPVITTGNSAMQEITGGSALFADPGNPAAIAEQLMRLYKDENKRDELVKAGDLIVKDYHFDKTADLFWSSIQKAVSIPAPAR